MQPQYWSIERLPGLMPPEQKLLQSQGIKDTAELLKRTRTKQSRQHLASKLKLNQKHLNKWVVLADLARLPSVGDRYCATRSAKKRSEAVLGVSPMSHRFKKRCGGNPR